MLNDVITGLNHLTLAVSDIDRSIAFYSGLLGFSVRMRKPRSAYLEAGTLWLALVLDPEARRGPLPEYSHAALGIAAADLPSLAKKLTSAGVQCWQESKGAASFYFLDPDGHKLELHSGNLETRLEPYSAGVLARAYRRVTLRGRKEERALERASARAQKGELK